MSPWDGKMDGSCTVWLGVKRQSDGRSDDAVGRPLAPNEQEADGGTLHGGRTARGGSRDVMFFILFLPSSQVQMQNHGGRDGGRQRQVDGPESHLRGRRVSTYSQYNGYLPTYNVQRSRPARIWVAPPLRARRRRRDRGKRDRRPHRGCRLHSHLHLHWHLGKYGYGYILTVSTTTRILSSHLSSAAQLLSCPPPPFLHLTSPPCPPSSAAPLPSSLLSFPLLRTLVKPVLENLQ